MSSLLTPVPLPHSAANHSYFIYSVYQVFQEDFYHQQTLN